MQCVYSFDFFLVINTTAITGVSGHAPLRESVCALLPSSFAGISRKTSLHSETHPSRFRLSVAVRRVLPEFLSALAGSGAQGGRLKADQKPRIWPNKVAFLLASARSGPGASQPIVFVAGKRELFCDIDYLASGRDLSILRNNLLLVLRSDFGSI